ncbi:hypothetical protein ACFLUE_02945 [Chloroflexota bacterium]
MYAEWVMFHTEPRMFQTAAEILPRFATLHESLKGFNSQTFVGNDETGDYGCLSVWESEEDLDAAMKACIPEFEKAISSIVKETHTIKAFEVIEFKK